MKKRIKLPLPFEHQIVNGDFWKYRPRTVIAVHQTQIITRKLSTPNLLLLYSFGFYRKRPNMLLRNGILPTFLRNNQPAASDLPPPSHPPPPTTLPQTPAAQLACAYHKITDNLHITVILRCFDWLKILFIIITYRRLLSQCLLRILSLHSVSTLMLASYSVPNWLTQVLRIFCSRLYKTTWFSSSNLQSLSTLLLTPLWARF